jgi:hypothetical protein
VCFRQVPIPALACSPAPVLALHSSDSHRCIASRGGRGAPPRSRGDLTPGEAMTRGGLRSDVPLTGARIPACAGAPALRLERVLRSRAALGHASPAPASGIPVRNAGYGEIFRSRRPRVGPRTPGSHGPALHPDEGGITDNRTARGVLARWLAGCHRDYAAESGKRLTVVSAFFLSMSKRTSQYSLSSPPGVGSSAQVQPAMIPE